MERHEVILTDQAREDMRQAAAWENQRKPGLGECLLDELQERLFRPGDTPESGTIRYDDVRCASLRVFPDPSHYAVFREQHEVQVLRILPQSKEPFW